MKDSAEFVSTIEEIKDIDWKNEDVADYYENMPIEVLQDYALRGGFSNGCDVDIVYPYISNTSSVIDVGSAYGRVISYITKKGYLGEIYAIERSKNFYEYLKVNYSNNAEIIHADIKNFSPSKKVDAILWMWSGIGDFAKDEQLPILKHLNSWLKHNGVIILETILHTLEPKNATSNEGKSFVICSDHGTFYGYKPSVDEIQFYGEKLGFKYIKHIDYETTTKRHRILHVFSKRPI
jgi:SAM-dependent methyltransferase